MAYPVPQADPTAVFGRRILAVLIDALIVLVPVVLVASAEFEYVRTETLEAQGVTPEQFCEPYRAAGDTCIDELADSAEAVYFADETSAAPNVLWLALSIGLLVVLQGLTGWSPGKLLTGIRVVQEDGRAPGFVKALLRWLLWIVDGFPWLIPGLVGFITGLTTVGHRRVGDMAAKTFVVRREAAGAPIAVPGLTTTPSAGSPWGAPSPPGWDAPADAAPGWAAPSPAPPPAAAPPVAKEGPQWDQARGTYIQWDPDLRAWMQWDDGTKAWSRIPGQ